MKLNIKCHVPGELIADFHFFILNKGLNSGRPSKTPTANCFVFISETEQDADRAYWLCYAIWATQKFRYYLRGSVIPFICIGDVKQALELADSATQNAGESLYTSIELLHELDTNAKRVFLSYKEILQTKLSILRYLAAV